MENIEPKIWVQTLRDAAGFQDTMQQRSGGAKIGQCKASTGTGDGSDLEEK
jgi:hypothetical protein